MDLRKFVQEILVILIAMPLFIGLVVLEPPVSAWKGWRRRRRQRLAPVLSPQEQFAAVQRDTESRREAFPSEPSESEDEYRLPTLPMTVFDPDQRDIQGITPLIDAVHRRSTAKVYQLLDAEANTEIRLPTNDETVLILATKNNDFDIVLMLLRARARVDAFGYSGMTALMYAACYGYTPIARILLEYGADPNRTTKAGRSARFYASRSNRNNIGNLFEPMTSERFSTEGRQE